MRTRKRNLVAPGMLDDWDRTLKKWLNSHIGNLPLSDANNGALKQLVSTMCEAGLAAKTINTYTDVVKMVVASAVDENGEEVYPSSGITSSSTCRL